MPQVADFVNWRRGVAGKIIAAAALGLLTREWAGSPKRWLTQPKSLPRAGWCGGCYYGEVMVAGKNSRSFGPAARHEPESRGRVVRGPVPLAALGCRAPREKIRFFFFFPSP